MPYAEALDNVSMLNLPHLVPLSLELANVLRYCGYLYHRHFLFSL